MGERLTESDVEKIKAEIEDRKLNQRPKLVKDVAEAAAQGDRSENFEYYAAKRANNRNNSRIRYLENMLKNATIVSDQSESGTVGLNKTVTIYIPEDDEEETYKIVTSIRGDSLHGKISIESPLGKALMGHKVGDTVTITVDPSYSYKAQIKSIDESTDDSDDQIKKF